MAIVAGVLLAENLLLLRAKEIAAGDWAGAAVKKAIDAVNATYGAIVAAGVVGSSG